MVIDRIRWQRRKAGAHSCLLWLVLIIMAPPSAIWGLQQLSGCNNKAPTTGTTTTISNHVGDNGGNTLLSRRDLFGTVAAAALPFLSTAANANAADVVVEAPAKSSSPSPSSSYRDQLLKAIENKSSDEVIFSIIDKLKKQDPSNGKAATYPDRLDGRWELIWSYGAEGFSPLLKLPRPFKPDSYQYFGQAAANEIGQGRIAQGLTGGVLGASNQLWLSSGAVPSTEDPSVLVIQPPFRLELGGPYGSNKAKQTLVNAGDDAEFRKVNLRTTEAQQAGRNMYQQVYLENSGPGSLRISTVIAGDPVLVGEMFVHRKL